MYIGKIRIISKPEIKVKINLFINIFYQALKTKSNIYKEGKFYYLIETKLKRMLYRPMAPTTIKCLIFERQNTKYDKMRI